MNKYLVKKQRNSKTQFVFLLILGLLVPICVFAMVVRATVVTRSATNITLSSVLLRGDVTDDGGCVDLKLWFQYGKNTSYGRTTPVEERRHIGAFSVNLSGLSPCTQYHFRAVAQNNTKKNGYGEDKTFTTKCPSFSVKTSVKNLSRGDTVWYDSLKAEPFDQLLFKIRLESTSNIKAQNIKVKANLPPNISYQDNLRIDGVSNTRNISSRAINVGNLLSEQTKTITFEAKVASIENLGYGTNNLITVALVYTNYLSRSNSCKVMVQGRFVGVPVAQAAGLPTEVSTGIGNTILDSVLLPLAIAFSAIWIFKSKLLGLDRWTEARKRKIGEYRANKKLKRKIARIKPQEN